MLVVKGGHSHDRSLLQQRVRLQHVFSCRETARVAVLPRKRPLYDFTSIRIQPLNEGLRSTSGLKIVCRLWGGTQILSVASFIVSFKQTIVNQAAHNMMSWNLTAKKPSTDSEYGVWQLISFKLRSSRSAAIWTLLLFWPMVAHSGRLDADLDERSCSFTYQFLKNPIQEPLQEESQNVGFESKITERTKFFQ